MTRFPTSKIEELAQTLKKDYTIIMVTHNMQQAARISDKTAFFLLGEVIEYGDTEQLFPCRRTAAPRTISREVWIMRSKFDEQLEYLNVELIKMGALCEEAISSAIKALLDDDHEMARKTRDTDREIDQKERDIESLCLKLCCSSSLLRATCA